MKLALVLQLAVAVALPIALAKASTVWCSVLQRDAVCFSVLPLAVATTQLNALANASTSTAPCSKYTLSTNSRALWCVLAFSARLKVRITSQ